MDVCIPLISTFASLCSDPVPNREPGGTCHLSRFADIMIGVVYHQTSKQGIISSVRTCLADQGTAEASMAKTVLQVMEISSEISDGTGAAKGDIAQIS